MGCGGYILVVDDDPDVRDALCDFVSELGCTTRAAANGVDALERLRDGLPCLVLLDLNMPRLDGAGFAARVRADACCAHVPIISMSAGAQRLGPPLVQCHIAKPIDVRLLTPAIERHCAAPARA